MDGMDNNIQNGNVPNNDVPMTNNVPNVEPVMDTTPNVEPVMNSAPNMDPFMNSTPNVGPVMSDVPTNNMDSNSPKKANTKFIIIGVVIAVLLIAGLGGLFGYKSYVGKPINLYSAAIEHVYEEFSEALNSTETFDITKDSIVMSGDVKINSSLAELESYTKYTYGFDVGLDVKNKKMQLGASMSDESKEILSAMLYYLDKTAYMDSKQLYDKVLYMVMDEDIFADIEIEETTIDYEKIDKIAEKLSKYIINGLDEKKFEKESATVKIDGKDVKVNKVVYPINQDTAYTMVKSLLEDIKGDDELLGLIAEMTGVDKQQYKDALNSFELSKDDLETDEDYEAEFYLYTKGFFEKVVGFGFEVEDSIIYYVEDGDKASFVLKGDGLDVTANTIGTKTEGKIVVEEQQLATFTLDYVEKDKNTSMDLTVNLDVEGTKLVVNYSADVTEESEKKAKGTFEANVSMTVEGQTIDVGAKVNLNVEIGAKLDDVNTSGAVDFSTLDSAELEKIQTNLEKALEGTFLADLLESYGDDYDDYDDDYDDYYDDWDDYDDYDDWEDYDDYDDWEDWEDEDF